MSIFDNLHFHFVMKCFNYLRSTSNTIKYTTSHTHANSTATYFTYSTTHTHTAAHTCHMHYICVYACMCVLYLLCWSVWSCGSIGQLPTHCLLSLLIFQKDYWTSPLCLLHPHSQIQCCLPLYSPHLQLWHTHIYTYTHTDTCIRHYSTLIWAYSTSFMFTSIMKCFIYSLILHKH